MTTATRPRNIIRTVTGRAGLLVLTGFAVAATATPAVASTYLAQPTAVASAATPTGGVTPMTASGCTLGSSSGNVRTCLTITGSGLHVDEMVASATVLNSPRKLQECLARHKPDGTFVTIGCTPFVTVGPGDPPLQVIWPPNSDVTPGDYCARTWRKNADGTATLIGEQCLNVHS